MNISQLTGRLGILAIALGLAACGGGGSGSGANNPLPPAPPAGPTSVAVVGTITGFGSVYVNGIRYEVGSSTVVDIEGEAETIGDDSGLRLGMKVHVVGDDNGGQRSAARIEYDDDLRGVVESVMLDAGDPGIGSFTVVGLTVTVDADTVFDDDVGNNDGVPGIDLRDLEVGMVVEISGFPTDSGFLATRVDREFDNVGGNPDVGRPDIDDDELEIKGFVESIAADNTAITVNGIDFLIDNGTFFDDGLMLNDDLLGVFVEVKADIAGSDYVAVRVEREDELDDDDRNGEFEIEGVLQSVDTSANPNTFTINGITVPVTDASSLVALVGMRVEIKGSFNADQVLVLREAEQDAEDNVRTEDLISAVDINAVSFTTRLGLTVSPSGGSRVEDDAGDDDNGDRLTPEAFINRLQIGDRIEARGIDTGGTAVSWNRVERDETAAQNDDFECELRGPVESVSGDAASFSFVIQGITVLTDSVADNNFQGDDDQILGRSGFFEQLDVGDIVEAESFEGDAYCMPGTLDAREVEFELDDNSPSSTDG